MARKRKLGVKKIKQILSESAFDPNQPGPLKVITDLQNAEYYRMRAIELIREGQLKLAISLLALARAENESLAEEN